MRAKRHIKLSPEEINGTLERYEAALATGKPPWSRSKLAICKLCRHEERQRLNRLLLEGKIDYTTLRKQFDSSIPEILRHWSTHLAPFIDPEFNRASLLRQVDKIDARRRFPTAPRQQYQWIQKQLLVARNLLLDEIEAGIPVRMPHSEAVQEYIEVLMKIKDIIPLAAAAPKKAPEQPKPSNTTDIDDDLTEEQEEEIIRARAEREKRQSTEEDKDGYGEHKGHGRADPRGEGKPAADSGAEVRGGREAPQPSQANS